MLNRVERLILRLKNNEAGTVDLAGQRLNSAMIQVITEALKENNSLEKLILGSSFLGCDLGDEGLKQFLPTLIQHPKLNYLDLRANKITDVGASCMLACLEQNKMLQKIDLRSNPVSTKVVDSFEKIINEKKLKIKVYFETENAF